MKTKYILLPLLLAFVFVGCQDLAVENRNNPDRILALGEPQDVENLIRGTFDTYWSSQQWSSMSMLLTTMADENSSAWANWGMRDLSSEPRITYNNDPSYSRSSAAEDAWFRSYTLISNANDGLQTIAADEARFTGAGIDVTRAKAFAKVMQGMAHVWLATYYDQAFIVDEAVDLQAVALGQAELNLSPYTDVMAAGLAMIDEGIALANSGSFELGPDWIFGLTLSNADLVKFANSVVARSLAWVARSPEERAAANWNEILSRINAGITEDFIPVGDDDGTREWSSMHFYGQNGTTWSRADYRTIGAADEGGGYDAWLATPLQDRLVFDISTRDRRVVGDAADLTVDGKYFEYQGNNGPFPSSRGTYHYSSHNHKRWQEYNAAGANGPMPYMLMTEMDMLRAEALLRTGGSTSTVADLINRTRVANGELPAISSSNPTGSPSDAHSLADNASLWSLVKYEKRIETFQTAGGLAYFDDRGFGDLVSGTPVHFPVPGAELETLGLQIYTFGGGDAGSAPKDANGQFVNNERFARTK